ncbi:hypothetical protein HYDPIDRAFT_172100 [Hydnomerulius pinastri MD-312]|nr:hypothetical protein HYDPIDRAFT_172100 [Hydnomerulius pinastri MD-312]
MPSSPFDSEQPRALMGGPSSRSTTLSSDNPTTLPPPWIECVHPQGWLYFFHPELRIVSVEDIRDPHVYEIVMEKIPHYTCDDTEGELEIRLHGLSSKPVPFDYLAINHKHLLASHDLAEVQSKNVPLLGPVQIYRARKHYWNYMSRYPVHMPTPSNALQDAVDALVWYFTDNLVSGASSTVPFSKEECEELLRLLQHSNIYSGSSPSKTVFLAWILEEVYSFRVGENYAKFTEKQGREFRSKPQSLRGPQAPPRHRSLFMDKLMNTIIVVLCFGIPWTYMVHVKSARTYKGRLANVQKTWDAYIARLVQEYSNFLLIVSGIIAVQST